MLSSRVAEYAQRVNNVGPLESPARYGVSGVPGDGPSLQFWLRVEGDQIKDAAYCAYPCPSAIASASLLCDLVRGRTVEIAARITGEDLAIILGELPPGKGHLPGLAVETMRKALQESE